MQANIFLFENTELFYASNFYDLCFILFLILIITNLIVAFGYLRLLKILIVDFLDLRNFLKKYSIFISCKFNKIDYKYWFFLHLIFFFFCSFGIFCFFYEDFFRQFLIILFFKAFLI
jgi:hypothetical protein